MRKEQICPFSLRAELIGIWSSVRHGTPLRERLKGTVDNLRSTRREVQDQSANSSFEYQEGVDRKGRPDLVHPRFGSMTDSLLRFFVIQTSPEGRKIAKFQLRQWLLIKEAALELKEGEEIYAFIPKMIEIEDGVALMRLRKDGDRFLAQSRLLPQDFDQEKASLLFEKFKEKGLKIKDLTSDEPSLIFQIAKGEKKNSVDLKDDLPQILTELSRPVLVREAQESQISRPLPEFSPSTSFSLFELVLPREGVAVLPQNKVEKLQMDEVELFLNQSEISVTHNPSLHNFQRSQENVQLPSIEENVFVEESNPVEKNKEIFVRKEQILNMEQQEMVVETVTQPRIEKEREGLVFVAREEIRTTFTVNQSSKEQPKQKVERKTIPAEREEVVVFEATEPVTELATSVTEPFIFIRKKPILLPVEEVVLPVLVVPNFEQAEQTIHLKEETSQGIIREMIEKEVGRREEQEEPAKTKEEKVILLKRGWIPKIAPLSFPLDLFSAGRKKVIPEVSTYVHPGGVNRDLRVRERHLNWIELIPPKEMSIITALARDKFGVNYPNSSVALADLTLFWLAAMSLFTRKPTLYKLKLDFTLLTVRVEDGKILVARKVIPKEILGRESFPVEERQFSSRPFLFLTA